MSYKTVAEVAARVGKLAEWYTKFKPDVKRIAITKTDWNTIAKDGAEVGNANGFYQHDKSLTFRGFTLYIPEQSAKK